MNHSIVEEIILEVIVVCQNCIQTRIEIGIFGSTTMPFEKQRTTRTVVLASSSK